MLQFNTNRFTKLQPKNIKYNFFNVYNKSFDIVIVKNCNKKQTNAFTYKYNLLYNN